MRDICVVSTAPEEGKIRFEWVVYWGTAVRHLCTAVRPLGKIAWYLQGRKREREST